MKPAGGGGADDLFAEMKAKPIKLRATGGRTASGKFQPQAAGSERNGDVQVGLPGVRALRRPKPKPEPPKELSELEKVRMKMAKKMEQRLRQIEQQEVAESWDDPPPQAQEQPAQEEEPQSGATLFTKPPVSLQREGSMHYV